MFPFSKNEHRSFFSSPKPEKLFTIYLNLVTNPDLERLRLSWSFSFRIRSLLVLLSFLWLLKQISIHRILDTNFIKKV